MKTTDQGCGLRGVQQLVREGADDLVVAAERVELLPLVDDQQQPLRPRLLVQGDFGEVAEGQRPFLETGGLLVGLFSAVHLVLEVGPQQGGECVHQAVQGPGRRHHGDDFPDRFRVGPQPRHQAGPHHGRLAAAGGPQDGHERMTRDGRDELVRVVLSAEEEGGVLLAVGEQAAERADGPQGGLALRLGSAGASPRTAAASISSGRSSSSPARRSTQVLSERNPSGGSEPGSRTGTTGIPATRLAVEGEVLLALLPAAHLAGPEEDGDGLAPVEGLLQGRRATTCRGPDTSGP